MTIDDLKYSIRPILFDVKNEYAQYSMLGTSFGVSNNNEFYIITLKHVIGDVETTDICFSYGFKDKREFREFLPINEKSIFKMPSLEDDTDKYELIAFRVDKNSLKKDIFDDTSFIQLSNKTQEYSSYDYLLIMGFPAEVNGIEYDEKKIKNQRFIVSATWSKKAVMTNCHMININANNDLSSYSGLSGSPIFGIQKLSNTQSSAHLLGVMLRATKSSGTGYFLEAEGIKVLTDG